MPTTPFTAEHEVLRDTVRRLVDGPLAEAAAQAERGDAAQAPARAQCEELGLLAIDDVLAEIVVAQELGRLRSGGIIALLLDAMLLHALDLPARTTSIARGADVTITDAGAAADLPFVLNAAASDQCLVLDAHVVVDVDPHAVTPLHEPLSLRGGAPALIQLRNAGYRRRDVDRALLRRAELRQAAAAVGSAEQTFADARDYADQRDVFGRPVSKFQVNRHSLALMATKITAAEALVFDTAVALTRDAATETAAARLYAGTVATEVADRALQLHGGYGYTTDYDVSRAWRDARALRTSDLTLRARLTARGTST